jgi:hypothetical protein
MNVFLHDGLSPKRHEGYQDRRMPYKLSDVQNQLAALLRELGRNLRDLLPILCVVALFQWLVIGQPMPQVEQRLGGVLVALVGLTLFVRGLAMSIFPLGESLADGLAQRGSLWLLIVFGFALGFGSTVAEPALAAVADQAALAAASTETGAASEAARFSLFLRYTVATAVGLAVALGVLRIVKGWPIAWFVLPGYGVAAALAMASDAALPGIAFDAGAAATSAINIPLMMALGVGLASMIRERNPLVDGFGLVALASLMPAMVILIVSLVIL